MSNVLASPWARERRPSILTKPLQGAELFAAARLALGTQMYSAGIDDGKTYLAIKQLNQLLSALRLDPDRQNKLRAERERLFLQLADEALQYDAPLPGAEREYGRVRLLAAEQRSSA
jgi:hypothetical protein